MDWGRFLYGAGIDPGSEQELKKTFGDVGPWPTRFQDQSFDYREVGPAGVDFVEGVGTGAALAGMMPVGGITWRQASKELQGSAVRNTKNAWDLFKFIRDSIKDLTHSTGKKLSSQEYEEVLKPSRKSLLEAIKNTTAVGKAAGIIENTRGNLIKDLFKPVKSVAIEPGLGNEAYFSRPLSSPYGYIRIGAGEFLPHDVLNDLFHELTHANQVVPRNPNARIANRKPVWDEFLGKEFQSLDDRIYERADYVDRVLPGLDIGYLVSPHEVQARGVAHRLIEEIGVKPQYENMIYSGKSWLPDDVPSLERALDYILNRQKRTFIK